MKLSGPVALLVLAASTSANVLRVPVSRISPGAVTGRALHPRLSKRASFTESLVNNITGGGYYASVSVGTPGQALDLVLDTGSSDAFLIAKDADLCEDGVLQYYYGTSCGPTYDPSLSSTYEMVDPDGFLIEYLDGSTASGDYIADTFEIGGATINALQMGLAESTVIGTGVLGIGFTSNEATEDEYPNLIDQMLNQSLIPTRAYSLYLNDYSSSTGNILFGGVDTEKFIGKLVVVPIIPDADTQSYTSFQVGMTAVSLSFSNGTTYNATVPGDSLDSILDSGTTLSYLPDDIATPIFDAVGVYTYTSVESSDLALVDCDLLSSGLEFTFRFNNAATITVPANELVIDAFDQDEIPARVPFDKTCLFGIQNSGSSASDESDDEQTDYALLGDTFLRSAYVVYDLDNKQVGLAEANLNSTKSNVQALSANMTSLPTYTGVAKQEGTSTASVASGTAQRRYSSRTGTRV
ncbi:putative aspartic-type endopeptidase opsB [Cytospora mali]|uniref:Aspartic-type endopeptidase opsB n=1 Tax=Cytospora mali TaxID=578113 RepID=A0A194UWP6_CYTMA|nr:putative aspartic-type endopeptidase opsB [Valsa mali var. pyri (nom. inval.)]